MDNGPKKLTKGEWAEIVRVEAVKEGWGLENKEDEKAFKENAYAVKFDYMSDGPGYAGDLFVLLGGEAECSPVVIIRRDGKLVSVDSSDC